MKPKKRKPGRPRVSTPRELSVTLKSVPEWKTWLNAFADYCGLSVSDTIGQALVHYAELQRFRPPPKR